MDIKCTRCEGIKLDIKLLSSIVLHLQGNFNLDKESGVLKNKEKVDKMLETFENIYIFLSYPLCKNHFKEIRDDIGMILMGVSM